MRSGGGRRQRAKRAAVLRGHIDALSKFEREYRDYVFALEEEVRTGRSYLHRSTMRNRRASLLQGVARAERAIAASGVTLRLRQEPMFGPGPELTSLASQILAHEQPAFSSSQDPLAVARMVEDGLGSAVGALKDKLDQLDFPEEVRGVEPEGIPAARSGRSLPTLIGRIKFIPPVIGFIADIGGSAVVAGALLKLLGII
jgi:hypothetical protein